MHDSNPSAKSSVAHRKMPEHEKKAIKRVSKRLTSKKIAHTNKRYHGRKNYAIISNGDL